MVKASICTIGDEILIGQIVDTNSSEIAKALGSLGIRTGWMVSIGDNREEILSSLSKELRENDIVITTGGLGPTKDDITKAALAELSGSKEYVENKEQAEITRNILHSRGLDVLDINKAQAFVPESCEVIANKIGTAPIMVFRMSPELFGRPVTLYAMPGVPFETLNALPDVLADIKKHYELTAIRHRNIMTYGIAESTLAKMLAQWEDKLPECMHLAYLPDPLKGVRLRLSIYGGIAEDEDKMMEEEISKLRNILGEAIYSEQDDTMEHAVGELLKSRHLTLSAAESCTGGEISHLITSVPGSSAYYLGSVTSYAIEIKEKLLGVPAETIEKHGVVSSEVAAAMADGVRNLTGSDYSVSTTGFSGPGGGDERYPEGTVWIGASSRYGTETMMYQSHHDRIRNIERFSATALYFLFRKIKSENN